MSEPTKDLKELAREATYSVRREVWSHFSQDHNLHLLESQQDDIDHYYEKAFIPFLHRAQALEQEVCGWTSDDDGIWHTECNTAHQFTTDGPRENKHRWCPYCGGEIQVKEKE